ncbi:hypothetical protein MMC11_008345 [Xylographa trunciseda]|nr:hypothetical protein [Xylographa trunciseda]
MSHSPIEENLITSYEYIDLMEKGQAFPADLLYLQTRRPITEHCREVPQASTRVLSNNHTTIVGSPQPILHRGTSALGVLHSPSMRTSEAVLPNNSIDDNNNVLRTIDHEQRVLGSAEYRASIAAMFSTLYPGYIADYHAQNSSNTFREENAHRARTPLPATVNWPSPTVSEFLRVASPSTSWIDADRDSDERSSTSSGQEEELPEIPHLSLGSPLIALPVCGLFNIHEEIRVLKAPFRHRIPERAPSFENLECGWERPNPRGNYLRTLGCDGRLSYVPFSPAAKIQYAESEPLMSEELVALNQDSPLVLRVKRARAKGNQKITQHAGEPHWKCLSGLQESQSRNNIADTTLPPPGLSGLARSRLDAKLALLRTGIAQLKSAIADQQLRQAKRPGHLAPEQDNTIHNTVPVADLDFQHPSLHQENATLGNIANDSVLRSYRMRLTPDDRRRDGIVFDDNFRVDSLLQSPGYDRDNVSLRSAPIDELCHPCHMGLKSDDQGAEAVTLNEVFHIENPLESPVDDHGDKGVGDTSTEAASRSCHMGLAARKNCDDGNSRNMVFPTESLAQLPELRSEIPELGNAAIGQVCHPRRVELMPEAHRCINGIYKRGLHLGRSSEPANPPIYDITSSPYGAERHWAGNIFNNGDPAKKRALPPTPRPRNAELPKQMRQDHAQPQSSHQEGSMLSQNSFGTILVRRLRPRNGTVLDRSPPTENRNFSAGISSTFRDDLPDGPSESARIAYNHKLTLAMLERRVHIKEFGSPRKQDLEINSSNSNVLNVLVPDQGGVSGPEVTEDLAIPVRAGDAAAPSPQLYDKRHVAPAQRRLSVQWVDAVPHAAAALPLPLPLAEESPISVVATWNANNTEAKITSHSSSKVRRSPKAWLREKARRLARILR